MTPLLVMSLGAAAVVAAEMVLPLQGGSGALVLLALFLLWGATPVALGASVGVALAVLAVLWLLLIVGMALRNRGRRALLGGAELMGAHGTVVTAMPLLRIRVRGELWQATASMPLPVGAGVRVRAIRGLTLEVEPDPPNFPADPSQHAR
ncbi:MAG TPA: NfeD family protein [Acidiferrobacteraceae bacterium]|nr:NfeD family protein [Acidiferrobacteraceae bacterium]